MRQRNAWGEGFGRFLGTLVVVCLLAVCAGAVAALAGKAYLVVARWLS